MIFYGTKRYESRTPYSAVPCKKTLWTRIDMSQKRALTRGTPALQVFCYWHEILVNDCSTYTFCFFLASFACSPIDHPVVAQ